MKDKLNYISSDSYKIETFKIDVEIKLSQMSLLSINSYSKSNTILETTLNKLENLCSELNENISINQVLTKLILIEKDFASEMYRNEVNINLENLLFFIIDSKLNLLINTKSVIENVIKLTESAMISDNQELKKAGNIIINELLKHDNEYKPLNQRLNNALKIIEDYYKAVEVVNRYNNSLDKYEHLSGESKFKEVTSFCEKISIIISENYDIRL